MDKVLHCIFHSLIDTAQVFLVVFLLYIVISFIEGKISRKLSKTTKFSVIIGASIGLIPQCGFSIVSADLYRKKKISIGTLMAVFIACSDEAIPIILANPTSIKSVLPLLLVKFISAIAFGYILDLIFKSKRLILNTNEKSIIHKGCCHHEIEDKDESNIKKHLLHPFIHSLKIAIYIFIINLIFELGFEYIGEDNIKNFILSNSYLTPLLSSLIGLIPNCASSVIISELYVNSTISFAACISGLICNAGLGLVFLYKDKKQIKNSLLITLLLFTISLIVGYSLFILENI